MQFVVLRGVEGSVNLFDPNDVDIQAMQAEGVFVGFVELTISQPLTTELGNLRRSKGGRYLVEQIPESTE